MGLSGIVRKVVALANNVTSDLQDTVIVESWVDQEDSGAPVYSSPRFYKAVVEEGASIHRTSAGEVIPVKGSVMFVQQLPPNGTPGRQEPLDPRDRITMPSGVVGLAVDIEAAPVDPGSSQGFYSKAFIG